jgi:multidrug efflux pump subunit AcrB
MWIVRVALSRPYTFVAMALLILLISPIVILRTPTDIFPDINIPVISVVWTYTGLPAPDMTGRITTVTERGITTDVDDIEHLESQTLGGVSVIKIFFHPSVNVQTALAQVTSAVQTQLKLLPPGITPPLVISYSASTVPVLQIGLSSPKLSESQLNDIGTNVIKTKLATVQGAAIPYPYGGKQRVVAVNLNVEALQSKGLSPVDVVNAINAQNLILPSGSAKIGPLEYNVEMNASPTKIAELNDIPIKTINGSTIYVRDVAQVSDGFTPQTNVVRQDGIRGALMTILKHGSTSTLSIVAGVKSLVPEAQKALPPDLRVSMLFDQSLFVRAAIQGVLREGGIAACLTAMMILLFLGSWRSTLIVALSIPLAILTSLIVLSALGETINIMTLGGLSLAVGILVDDATVEIENTERHLGLGKPITTAILDGANEIAVPTLVSTLSICIVFIPMFLLSGVARYLFVPLAEAVVFAMLASYLLSRTLVPTMMRFLLQNHHESKGGTGFFSRFHQSFEHRFEQYRAGYYSALKSCVRHRKVFVPGFLAFCVLSCGLVPFLGQDFFPSVDAGEFHLHVRARAGLRVEETTRLCDQIEQALREEIPTSEIQTVLDNIGLPFSGMQLSYSNTGTIGTGDADILVALNANHHPTDEYVKRLREVLPARFPGVDFFFQPADIVSQILNFGLPAPIDVQIVGNAQDANFRIAQHLAGQIKHVPGAVDVHVQQMMTSPTLHFDMDRTFAQQVGLSARDLAQNMLISLSGSFQTTPTFWLNPQNGVSYNIVTQTPQYRITSLQALMNTPIDVPGAPSQQIMANLGSITPINRANVVSHYNVQPVMDVYASVSGRDLGGVAKEVQALVKDTQSKLKPGNTIVIRGQVQTMNSSFLGLGAGLILAIALVYLLIVVNFQSWLDPFIIITALPGALAGISWILFLTRTTLSVPALMGAVMCIGVATANSILMVTFARERLALGVSAINAALEAGFTRLRPVTMTALAMIMGMIPMAIGLGEGGEQNAPLGRAVIGGLMFATMATLFFVPVIFSMLHGRKGNHPPQAA